MHQPSARPHGTHTFAEARIRLATLDDLPGLLKLEAFWRSDVLSAPEATLRRRIVAHPTGQFVAVAPDGQLLGVMYTQRVASYETLLTAQRETELDLHTPAGPVVWTTLYVILGRELY